MSRFVRIDADGAMDASGFIPGPISAILEVQHPASGDWPHDVPAPAVRGSFKAMLLRQADADVSQAGRDLETIARPGRVLMPGLVNAHTHLDLTHLGPFPEGRGSLPRFFTQVRQGRLSDAAQIAAAARLGVGRSLAGGVVAVGDIAGCPPAAGPCLAAIETLAASPLRGVGYLEFFAIGTREASSLGKLDEVWQQATSLAKPTNPFRLGLHPHAPYSVSPRGYAHALRLAAQAGVPISTHLAEGPGERQLIAKGTGPTRSFLEGLGLWTDDLLADFGRGRSPIAHVEPFLAELAGQGHRPLLVHLNQLADADIELIARYRSHAVYCPRSSEYFESHTHFGPHRYRDLLAAGVRVCLGTDSILNCDGPTLSTLDEARLLHQRDGMDPVTLAAMLTTHGAAALGLPEEWFRFSTTPATLAGLIAIPARDAAEIFRGTGRPELVAIGR